MKRATETRGAAARRAEPQRLPSLLTYKQAAAECGISKMTIRRAVSRGDLQAMNAPGTKGASGKRITAESLRRYLKYQRVEAKAS